MKKGVACAIGFCAFLAGGVPSAKAVIIDSFDDGLTSTSLTTVANSGVISESGLTSAIGGQRDAYLELTAVGSGGSGQMQINVASSSNFVFGSSSANGLVTLSYGGGGDMNLNLNVGSTNSFRMLFDVADFGGPVTVIASSTGIGASTGSVTIAGGLQSTDPDVWYTLFFSSMTGAADFSNIDALSFTFDPPEDGDWVVKEIITDFIIPEPGLGLLLLPVLGGVLFLRRRLSKKA